MFPTSSFISSVESKANVESNDASEGVPDDGEGQEKGEPVSFCPTIDAVMVVFSSTCCEEASERFPISLFGSDEADGVCEG